ncbi:MAG: hypothetical protein ACETWG_01415 [Candidatus Neomarinimicrobiota bacterium]
MIETLDPNLSMPPPLQPDAQQTEPIRPESVKIEQQKLERRKSGEEEAQEKKRRGRKDKVELSSQAETADETPEDKGKQTPRKTRRRIEHKIDILI